MSESIFEKFSSTRFPLGRLVATRRVTEDVPADEMLTFVYRHARGDWGDVPPEDARANEDALKIDARILSAYESRAGERVWIITEADRSSTTVLFRDEY